MIKLPDLHEILTNPAPTIFYCTASLLLSRTAALFHCHTHKHSYCTTTEISFSSYEEMLLVLGMG